MPFQNRVDPWGQLNAVSHHGAYLGNRGILHNDQQLIIAPWQNKEWITCQLQFKNTKRTVFAPGLYSELFFLDEATALSAGHRPCGYCRRERFNEFKEKWLDSNRDKLQSDKPSIGEIDKILHSERVTSTKAKRTFEEQIGNLPQGTFIELKGEPLLLWRGKLLQWSFEGYSLSRGHIPSSTIVQVLTPASIVRLFSAGFTPQVHISAYN